MINSFLNLCKADVKKRHNARVEKALSKCKRSTEKLTKIDDSLLNRYSDEKLFAELRRRGFEGQVTKKVTLTI